MVYLKFPRLYVSDNLHDIKNLSLSSDHAHYLFTVMRKSDGESIRIFNGHDGEFIGDLVKNSKKSGSLINLRKIKSQPDQTKNIHLYFAPIKKDRLHFMIEKATELGVTNLHPILSDRTENRKLNTDKIETYIIEAAEQCERMNIPILHPPIPLSQIPTNIKIHCAIERQNDIPAFEFSLLKNTDNVAVMTGPEGGWTKNEIEQLNTMDHIIPVHLGDNILRAETAAIFMLSRAS